MTYGRTYDEQRFSPARPDQRPATSASWASPGRSSSTPTAARKRRRWWSTACSTPPPPGRKVYAFDAATGKLLWAYDPKVDGDWGAHACCDVVNRGVAVVEGQGLRRHPRRPADRARRQDRQRRSGACRPPIPTKPYTITGAPRVVKGKVLIGNGGAEFGVRGYVSAYDADTGKLVWRFYTVPGDQRRQPLRQRRSRKIARKTWSGEWWSLRRRRHGVGLHRLRPGAQPDLSSAPATARPGTNACAAPAARRQPVPLLDRGGERRHRRVRLALPDDPGREWDYAATQQMILADLTIDGAAAQGADAGAEERLLLCARPRQREAASRPRTSCR